MLSCALAVILRFHRAKEFVSVSSIQPCWCSVLVASLFGLCFPRSNHVRKLTFFAFIIRIWSELNSILVAVLFLFCSAIFFFCVRFDYGVPMWNGIVFFGRWVCVYVWLSQCWRKQLTVAMFGVDCWLCVCAKTRNKRWWRWLTMSCLFGYIKCWKWFVVGNMLWQRLSDSLTDIIRTITFYGRAGGVHCLRFVHAFVNNLMWFYSPIVACDFSLSHKMFCSMSLFFPSFMFASHHTIWKFLLLIQFATALDA